MEDPDTDDQDFYELIKETIDNQDIIKKNCSRYFGRGNFSQPLKSRAMAKL